MDNEMSVGEKFVRDAYDKILEGKESFDEDMQKTIQSELERLAKEKEEWLKVCKETKLWMLWEILFETDVRNRAVLEARIYAYGSQIKETDYLHRDIFIWLVAFLNLVIK